MDTSARTKAEEELLQRRGANSVVAWASGLFVGTLGVFYVTLLFSYFMIRHEALNWPPEGHDLPPLAGMVVSTGALLMSIAPLAVGYLAIQRDQLTRSVLGISGMLVLGWGFFLLQAVSYTEFDLQPVDNVYSALIIAIGSYQLLVTLLALMMGGIVLVRLFLGHFNGERYGAVETLVYTWGFVVVSWLFTAGTLYLSPYVF